MAAVLASGSPPRSSLPPARASCARKSSVSVQLWILYARRCRMKQGVRCRQLQRETMCGSCATNPLCPSSSGACTQRCRRHGRSVGTCCEDGNAPEAPDVRASPPCPSKSGFCERRGAGTSLLVSSNAILCLSCCVLHMFLNYVCWLQPWSRIRTATESALREMMMPGASKAYPCHGDSIEENNNTKAILAGGAPGTPA